MKSIQARVTIIMTQRERFDLVGRSIESLFASTQTPFELIYVDGGASREVSKVTDRLAIQHGFKIIRKDTFLPPNIARNLAITEVGTETDYIAFVDNDVLYEQGWLEALVRCADETKAALVTPLIMIGNPDKESSIRIHFAGGKMETDETSKGVIFRAIHYFEEQKLVDVGPQLKRREVDCVEFHVALIRWDCLNKISPLDEELRGTSEHLDLSLLIKKHGGVVYFEPSSIITYMVGIPLSKHERDYFIIRWSDPWALYSERHFYDKWGFRWDPRLMHWFVAFHRLHAFSAGHRRLKRVIGSRMSRAVLSVWYKFQVMRNRSMALDGTM
jgi:GT2 family glycosyltransferase